MQPSVRYKFFVVFFLNVIFNSTQLFAQGFDELTPKGFAISSEVWSYNSYSQQKMGYPLKAGYPVIQAQGIAVSISYNFKQETKVHSLSLTATAPSGVTSNNGTGQNLLLTSNHLSYHKSTLGYKLWLNLFEFGKLKANHSISTGILYEYRNLTYISEKSEVTSDINLYVGPNFEIKYNINQQWQLIGGFDAHFYLPYINYGSLKTYSETGEQIFSSAYRAFYYQTNFLLGAKYQFNNQMRITIALSKDDLVGFANRTPSFKVNDIIHYKFDRVYALSVGVEF